MKPANLGSSVGVSKARDRDELIGAIDVALGFDEWIVVEEAIAGREIEVGVLGDDPPVASVPGEIVPGDDFYSYADKYEHDAAQLLAPAPLDVRRRPTRCGRSRCGRSRRAVARRWRGSTSSSRSVRPTGARAAGSS